MRNDHFALCRFVAVPLTLFLGCNGDPRPVEPGPSPIARLDQELLIADNQTLLTGFEPNLAVNPNDLNQIASARGCRLQISQNGPGNFGAVVQLPLPATHNNACGGDDVVAFDNQGRLFVTYLGFRLNTLGMIFNNRPDVFLQQVNPANGNLIDADGDVCGTMAANANECPRNITAALGLPSRNDANPNANDHDKEWIAIDTNTGSMFRDRLYVIWVDFNFDLNGDGTGDGGSTVLFTSSADQGANWTAPQVLSSGAAGSPGVGDGFRWPPHVAVAANGDVYAAFHSQPTFLPTVNGNAQPDNSGRIVLLRGTNGGQINAMARAIIPADLTFNRQQCGCTPAQVMAMTCPNVAGAIGWDNCPRTLNGSQTWTQGSAQPWIVTDPTNAANVAIVYSADPTPGMDGAANDDLDTLIAVSTTNGANGSFTSTTVPQAAAGAGALQLFPAAAADTNSACVSVAYYDTRNPGAGNLNGNSLLDVFVTVSPNPWAAGGPTWLQERQINDATNPYDPDAPGSDRFGPPMGANPVLWRTTTRMGEYFGLVHGAGVAWTGNPAGTANQVIYSDFSDGIAPVVVVPAATTVNSCTPPVTALGTATATDECGHPFNATTAVNLTASFPATPLVPGLNTVQWTGIDGAQNTTTTEQSVMVVDTTPPTFTRVPPPVSANNCGPVDLGAPAEATDDCGSATITDDHLASYPPGMTTVTYTARDAAGNNTPATQIVTVTDMVKPIVKAPPAKTITICVNADIGTATATDDCGVMSIDSDRPGKFPLGKTTVTWIATDAAGNRGTDTQVVTAVLGDDPSCCPTGTVIRLGNNGPNRINGDNRDDCIIGRGGDDIINGFGGNDFISGGSGRDTIAAHGGNNYVNGGDGDDVISVGNGNDIVLGGSGRDTIAAGLGSDIIDGGPDTDTCHVPTDGTDVVTSCP